MTLVLSIFPGLGLLDRAFEAEGFCIVRGPDPIWGGDVRKFSPPAGVFDGILGGDPCQSHSALSNLVRAKGLQPSFPDLTPEFQRVIEEARPRWFLRENVPQAPELEPAGYGVHDFLLDNAWLSDGTGMGQEQCRKRRFWFGRRLDDYARICVDLRRWLDFAAFELPDPALSVTAGHDQVVGGEVASQRLARYRSKRQSVTGGHAGEIGRTGGHRGSPGRYTLPEMLELQGLPADFLDHCPFTMEGKRKAIGNGVAQATGRALARAVREAIGFRVVQGREGR